MTSKVALESRIARHPGMARQPRVLTALRFHAWPATWPGWGFGDRTPTPRSGQP